MKVIILAAGYATRMGKLTENLPKALLPIKGKPLLNYLVEEICTFPNVSEIFIVTNQKFFKQFEEWKKKSRHKNIVVINDHTTSNENRLGAIGDISYVIDKQKLDDDIFVTVSDNFFAFKLKQFHDFFKSNGTDCVIGQKMDDLETLKRVGVATVDKNNVVTHFEEKPPVPKGNVSVYGMYFYRKETLKLFKQYEKEGNSMDSPGNFVAWLYQKTPVKAFVLTKDIIIDIGSPEAYSRVK